MPREPTVFIVDDDPAVCDALQTLLHSVGRTVEIHHGARSFLAAYDPDAPGCLLLDVRMPGMSGLELQAALAAHHIRLPVIVVTAHGDMTVAVRAMKAGALDCLAKPFDHELLLEGVEEAIRLDEASRRTAATRAEVHARLAELSAREREVMTGVVAGKTNRVIAEELGVATKTIDAHRARVMEKTQATSLAELVKLALSADELSGRTGTISPSERQTDVLGR